MVGKVASKAVAPMRSHPVDPSALEDDVEARKANFDQILYHITHDLRASMRAFKIAPDWITEDLKNAGVACPADVRESLDLLKVQAELADKLLVDLLTYSRVGRSSGAPAWQNLPERVAEAVSAANVPSMFLVHQSIDVARVFAPGDDLVTLLSALVHNAWWHHGSDHGVIEIEARMIAGQGGPERVQIAITDDGDGVPPEHHTRIFEMLTRLRPRDQHPGSGLGLAIGRKIVTYLGGSLEISPDVLSGARFEVTLPHPQSVIG